MSRWIQAVGTAVLVIASAGAAWGQGGKRPISVDDLLAMHRVSDPQMSPDGKYVAYTVATPDREANHSVSNIWVVPTDGSEPRQLTRAGSDQRPRWSPDGTKLAFLSSRDGATQMYWISLTGGEATRITSLSGGVDNELWSPDGKTFAFVSRLSRLPRRRMRRQARRREGQKQSKGPRLYETALSPLDYLVGWQARRSLRRLRGRWQAPRSDSRRGVRCPAFAQRPRSHRIFAR